MRGTLSYPDLASVFDWQMFAAVCGIKMGSLTPDASEALSCFRAEALLYLDPAGCYPCPGVDRPVGACLPAESSTSPFSANHLMPKAEYEVRFFECRRQGDVIVSEDGALRLPMLRQGGGERRSLCDLFPSATGAARLGLFAVKVDAPDGDTNPLIAHAARVCMAEAASEHLRHRFQMESGQKTFMPSVGYPCCPDHSLKRDILSKLDIGITLTDSCAMIPEASICGLVICSDDFELFSIRDVCASELEKYVAERAFDETEKRLYLYSLAVI